MDKGGVLPTDRVTACLCLSLARTADTPLMAAACGFDSIYVDLEHSAITTETASLLCIAAAGAGLIPLVRVPRLDEALITRLLDTGAHGIIVPHVDGVAQAQAVVRACRFPPLGERPMVGPNPVNGYRAGTTQEVMAACEAACVVAVMIESREALSDIDDIAAVPGLDLLILGAWDLSASLGIPQQFDHPDFERAVTDAAAACKRQNKILGIAGIADMGQLARFVRAGVRFISAGTDAFLLRQAATAKAAALRELPLTY